MLQKNPKIKFQILPAFKLAIGHAQTNDYRYYVIFGGRDSGKSWFIGQLIVLQIISGIRKKWLCFREIQKTLRESSYALIIEVIESMGLAEYFDAVPSDSRIKCKNGGEIVFVGLSEMSSDSIRSFQGFDGAWGEEANSLSKKSFNMLDPTIRKEDSIVLLTFNPGSRFQFIYQTFVVKQKADAWVQKINFDENVFLSQTSKKVIKNMKSDSYADYEHVYLGKPTGSTPMQLISSELVDKAVMRNLREHQYKHAPIIIACDPSWTGDDETVIVMRQGLFCKVLHRQKVNDNDGDIANLLIYYWDKYKADACFIDAGYGTGIYSFMKTAGYHAELIFFNGEVVNREAFNKRAEMYIGIKSWLENGGFICESELLLCEELCSIEKLHRDDERVQLVSKKDMAKNGKRSPNIADALALTFARNVQKVDIIQRTGNIVNNLTTLINENELYD